MSRINTIKKALINCGVNIYNIKEITENCDEQYYVKGKLETIRKIADIENRVTVYVKNKVGDKEFLGDADFTVTHNLSKKELYSLIEEAKIKASYIHNEPYNLVKNVKKQSYAYKELEDSAPVILQKIANIFFNEVTENLRYNALECFFKEITVQIVNSNNLNLKKKTYEINVEAIPSYYSEDFKTELYRMFVYDNLDYEKIKQDAHQALLDVDSRGKAVKIENIKKCNVILRDEHIKQLFEEIIYSLTYQSVHAHSNLKQIGDMIQNNPMELINLSLAPRNKADFFDNEGNLLSKHSIIENGKVVSYFGSNRFAQYLGIEAIGDLPKIIIKNGKKKIETLRKDPYIEIIDLSGIQVDAFSSYVGGEVRLALYYDGLKVTPISGFSFSTDLNDALNTMEFSKEKQAINNYEGPAFVRIKNAEIL